MGPRAGLDGQKISSPPGFLIPDHPARSSVAIPTEPPGPLIPVCALNKATKRILYTLYKETP